MPSYYKHKKKESIDVPYSFCCEQCMQDSGMLTATIVGSTAEINDPYRQLNSKKQQKLDEKAHAYLVSAVKEAYNNATNKKVYSTVFKDECPHCHKPQSWGLTGLKDEMYLWPSAWAIVGIILGVGYYFFGGNNNNLPGALLAGGVCFALAVGMYVWNMVKISNKKKQVSSASQQNEPDIIWDAVRHIIDEK